MRDPTTSRAVAAKLTAALAFRHYWFEQLAALMCASAAWRGGNTPCFLSSANNAWDDRARERHSGNDTKLASRAPVHPIVRPRNLRFRFASHNITFLTFRSVSLSLVEMISADDDDRFYSFGLYRRSLNHNSNRSAIDDSLFHRRIYIHDLSRLNSKSESLDNSRSDLRF
jgi:hypothetical protein